MTPHEIFRGISTQAESQRTNKISPFLGPRAPYKLEIMINTNGYHFFYPYHGLYLPYLPHDLHNSLWVGNCIHIFRWGNCSQRNFSWPMITRLILERAQEQSQACLTSHLFSSQSSLPIGVPLLIWLPNATRHPARALGSAPRSSMAQQLDMEPATAPLCLHFPYRNISNSFPT